MLLFGPSVIAGSGSALPYIGQMASSYAFVDGVSAPQGTTLFPDSLVTTKEKAATVHLKNGAIVEVAANSSAFFDLKAPEQIQVAVRSGSVRYGTQPGNFATAVSPTRVVLAQQSGQMILSNTGVVAVLLEAAPAGTLVLRVNDTGDLNRQGRLLIKSKDGSKYEVHYITRIQGNRIYLNTQLNHSYSPEDLLIQGCECDRAMGQRDDGLVGNLNEEVGPSQSVLKYTPVVPLDHNGKLMIKRVDGSIREVHEIKAYNGTDTITLDGKLKYAFEPGDILIQGCHIPPVFGALPWATMLYGGTAGFTTTITTLVIENCEDCSPCKP